MIIYLDPSFPGKPLRQIRLQTLDAYDAAHLYTNPFLDVLLP
jgi:hypothetical protein